MIDERTINPSPLPQTEIQSEAHALPADMVEWGNLVMRVFNAALADKKYSPAIKCLGLLRAYLEAQGQTVPAHLAAMEATLKASQEEISKQRNHRNPPKESVTIPHAPDAAEDIAAWKQRLMAIYEGAMTDKHYGVAVRTQEIYGCHMGYLGRKPKVVTVMTPEEEAAVAKQEADDALDARVNMLITMQGRDPNPVDEYGGYYDDETDEYVYVSESARKKGIEASTQRLLDFVNYDIPIGTAPKEAKAIKARHAAQTAQALAYRPAAQKAAESTEAEKPVKPTPPSNNRPVMWRENGKKYEFYEQMPGTGGRGWVLAEPAEPVPP